MRAGTETKRIAPRKALKGPDFPCNGQNPSAVQFGLGGWTSGQAVREKKPATRNPDAGGTEALLADSVSENTETTPNTGQKGAILHLTPKQGTPNTLD